MDHGEGLTADGGRRMADGGRAAAFDDGSRRRSRTSTAVVDGGV